MPPPDKTDPALVGPAAVPNEEIVVARDERRKVATPLPIPTKSLLERRRLQLQNELLEQEVSRLWWDKYTRLASCVAIFTVVIGWLWAVRQLLVLPATERPTDSVLIAALGTTTINVLGLLYIVARYLFPQQARAEIPIRPEVE